MPRSSSACALALALASLALAACNGGGATDAGSSDLGAPSDLGADVPAVDLGRDMPPGMDMPPCMDLDGDGHGALACGGDDCDDADSNRYPGNAEVCDAAGHDDDCNPATLGPDADHDGTPYVGCCNTQPDTTVLCGTDCDDTRATVGPTAVEACNGFDDNCNGMVDEGVRAVYCLDMDGDAHGDLQSSVSGCGVPAGATTVCNDCADYDMTRYPGAAEVCNGSDDNCNGAIDEGCACSPDGATQPCGFSAGACMAGMQTCIAGTWEATCAGATLPTLEVCNGVDDDCDFRIDEDVSSVFFPDCDGDGYGVDARAVTRCTRPSGVPAGCPRGVWSDVGGDCDDTDPTLFPGAGCGLDAGVDGGPDAGTMPPLPTETSIETAIGFTCAALSDGRVGCVGYDEVGQLGNGVLMSFAYAGPYYVTGLSHAVEVAVGGGVGGTGHGCARRDDGTVACWGASTHGELGFGGYGIRSLYVDVVGITDAVQIVAGVQHTCARHRDGSVSCWGAGSSGQLGNGGTADSAVPDVVFGITDAVQIAAGEYHTCAIHTGGAVSCWGNDFRGQLGDGATTNQSTPVDVAMLGGTAVAIAGGSYHTCAVLTGGAVRCWGANDTSQIGRGAGVTSMQELVPLDVLGLGGAATAVAAGDKSTCALLADTTIQCWGADVQGQLGSVGPTSGVPLTVPGLTGVTRIGVGGGRVPGGGTGVAFIPGMTPPYGWGAWNGDTNVVPIQVSLVGAMP